MLKGTMQDARDAAAGIKHYVMRWSGRKTDEPREVYAGIPSDAAWKMRLIGGSLKPGSVYVVDRQGREVDRWAPAVKDGR